MKAVIWGLVVALHCVAFGSLFIIQGCGTRGEVQPPPPPPMPPRVYTPPVQPPPVQTPSVVSRPLPLGDVKEYTVRKGDSLSVIAHRFGVTVSEIMDLNTITDKDVIVVGQKIKLPGRVDLDSPPEKPVVRSAPASSSVAGETYVVQSGDTLSEIALRFGVTVGKLREDNNLTGDLIKVGQKLKVASSSVSAPKPAAPRPPAPKPDPEPIRRVAPAVEKEPVMEKPEDIVVDEKPFAGTGIIHVVQSGETLEDIAKLYDTTPQKIADFNQVEVGAPLSSGMRISVP